MTCVRLFPVTFTMKNLLCGFILTAQCLGHNDTVLSGQKESENIRLIERPYPDCLKFNQWGAWRD